jgi:hypothetical protein
MSSVDSISNVLNARPITQLLVGPEYCRVDVTNESDEDGDFAADVAGNAHGHAADEECAADPVVSPAGQIEEAATAFQMLGAGGCQLGMLMCPSAQGQHLQMHPSPRGPPRCI